LCWYSFPGCCFGGGVVGWFCWLVLGSWFCGFGVGVVGLVGSPCDGFCMVCVGIVVAGGGVVPAGPAEEALSPSNVATAFHVIAHHVTTPEGSRELVCTAALPEPSRKEI